MSRSPYFFVERFDRQTQNYELQHPLIWNYEHTKRVTADLFPYNGCHEMFSIVESSRPYNPYPNMKGIHRNLPKDVCNDIAKAFDECSWETTLNGEKSIVTPNVYWFTYADMYIYLLENPTVVDYDAMEEADDEGDEDIFGNKEEIRKPNPLNALKERVDAFLSVCDDWDWENDYSLIRIVYWIL